jgi:hypothetical protein
VLYSTDHLLEKNKDYVVAENAALVASSASAFVRGLLVVPLEDGVDPALQRRNAFKLNSVGAQFRTQVCSGVISEQREGRTNTWRQKARKDQCPAETSELQRLVQRPDKLKGSCRSHP